MIDLFSYCKFISDKNFYKTRVENNEMTMNHNQNIKILKRGFKVVNNPCLSTISVQNRSKNVIKDCFFVKIKFVDNNDLF